MEPHYAPQVIKITIFKIIQTRFTLNRYYFRTAITNKIIEDSIFFPVTCDALNLANGYVSYNQSVVGERYPFYTKASFSCNEGYSRSGNGQITCQTSGSWNMDPPVCNAHKEMNIAS